MGRRGGMWEEGGRRGEYGKKVEERGRVIREENEGRGGWRGKYGRREERMGRGGRAAEKNRGGMGSTDEHLVESKRRSSRSKCGWMKWMACRKLMKWMKQSKWKWKWRKSRN